ncbi:tail fiber assembly protein [Salmonella enterica]|nr:tail fiber assembly protein [Salmonella enterica]EDB5956156.1 tail fiber assembly protein [Salmonella enterica subsp. enterica serovar Bareilly]EDX4491764.1 tail fiber assembly protein [Salmonella enterica subsp. salamae]EIL4285599.1 tail fiber assembly protein [Salmonella enterica subsp. enterica serovar Thompson]EBA4459232.1 tail fiber assembly protein [Salmonella enterica]
MYAFSNGNFYPFSMRAVYESSGSWPTEYIEIDESVFVEFSATPPDGKIRGTGDDGMPAWLDIPPPTQAEIVVEVEREKQRRIDAANEFMNSKQWPGKAAIGRLKGDELVQYNLWLDYLEALEELKPTSAPDIKWPVRAVD